MSRPLELAGLPRPAEAPPTGTRVVLDLRPLQEPERTPLTAAYLERLIEAFARDPVAGESFVAILRTLRPDPTDALEPLGLRMAGRRRVPPTARLFRATGLTIDSFLLRGAEVGSASGADRDGALGTVFHTAGGAVPLGSRLPVVATLLDLAPWELPAVYAGSPAARFGHRLRARILRDATRLIVCSEATAESARRRIHIRRERIAVVPLAAGPAYTPDAGGEGRAEALRERYGLPERYLAFAGRYDARKDLGTLFQALRALREEGPPVAQATAGRRRGRSRTTPDARPGEPAAAVPSTGSAVPREASSAEGSGAAMAAAAVAVPEPAALPWPPVVVLVGTLGAGGDEADALARAARRGGVADLVRVLSGLSAAEIATLDAGAQAFVYPAISEGAGLEVVEALATGTPVVASRVGPLPELVGSAGIIVEPRDPARLAVALRAIWGDTIRAPLARAARRRAVEERRTWADVARETRTVYATAAAEARGAGAERG